MCRTSLFHGTSPFVSPLPVESAGALFVLSFAQSVASLFVEDHSVLSHKRSNDKQWLWHCLRLKSVGPWDLCCRPTCCSWQMQLQFFGPPSICLPLVSFGYIMKKSRTCMPMISLRNEIFNWDPSGVRWWPGALLWQSLSASRGFSCSCRRRCGNALGLNWCWKWWALHCESMSVFGSCLKPLFVFCIRVGSSCSFSCSRKKYGEVRQMVMRKVVWLIATSLHIDIHIPCCLDLNRHDSRLYRVDGMSLDLLIYLS